MNTSSLLHDITLLERKLHGIITQRERMGVTSKEIEESEKEIKQCLAEKKQQLRTIMEEGEPPIKQPRQPALIKNGVSLEMLPHVMEIEDKLCSTLPVIEITTIDPEVLHVMSGPTVFINIPDDGAPNNMLFPSGSPRFAAGALSTYPHVPECAGSGRQGDPICDKFSLQIHSDSAVVALADGCNWGRLPFEAANKAVNGFVQYMDDRLTTITSLRGAGSLLLAALSAASKKITEGAEPWECGTTTLIGGLLLPILSSSHAPPLGSLPRSSSWSSSNSLNSNFLNASPGRTRAGSTSCTNNNINNNNSNSNNGKGSRSVFVCVSLGDCKAFHYSQRTQQFTDITEGNRQNLTDARDPGGRLGPYIEDQPDLRNLHLYFQVAEQDDLIILMSDGIHDNLDPQQLGVPPPQIGARVQADTWEEAEKLDPERVEAFKNSYRKNWLEDTFSKQLLLHEREREKRDNSTTEEKLTLDVAAVVDSLLQHCVNTTKASREFMEQNPKLKLPHDFKMYPGKLDHATCVCLKVGAKRERANT